MRPQSAVALCALGALLFSTTWVGAQEAGAKQPAPTEKTPEAKKPPEGETSPEAEKAAEAEKPAEGENADAPESTANEEAGSAESPEGAEAAAAEKPAAGQAEGASAPEAAEGEPAAEDASSEAAGEAAPAEAAPAEAAPAATEETPAPGEGRKSASSNQAIDPPQDDYEGASDQALVQEPEGPKKLSLGIALDLTWPLGQASNFIDSASVQGLSLDLRYYAWGNVGIGVGVALDSLSKKTDGSVAWDNAVITGTQVRELSYTPITAKGYYSWRDQERFVPYVAAGLGAARAVRRLVVGFSSLNEDSWHFAMVPEAGLQIPAGPTLILTNVRLNYLPPAGGVEEQIFANFSFGLSIQ